jgi:hypothetical protein
LKAQGWRHLTISLRNFCILHKWDRFSGGNS